MRKEGEKESDAITKVSDIPFVDVPEEVCMRLGSHVLYET